MDRRGVEFRRGIYCTEDKVISYQKKHNKFLNIFRRNCKLARTGQVVERQMVYSLDMSPAILRGKVWVIAGLTLMPLLITLATSPALSVTVMRIKWSPRQRQGFCLGKSLGKVWGGFCAQRADV